MISQWLREFFCWHVWCDRDGDDFEKYGNKYRPNNRDAVCRKCGKLSLRKAEYLAREERNKQKVASHVAKLNAAIESPKGPTLGRLSIASSGGELSRTE